jgi:Domain of Unknown Function (DUF1543)
MANLYMVFLGGEPAPGRMGEDHEVVLVVADDVKTARAQARAKWRGVGKGHVDAISAVAVVDGYRIQLAQTGEAEALAIDLTYEP